MTLIFILLGLMTLPSFMSLMDDPAPGLITSVESARRFDCERASLENLRKNHPGLLEDERPRGEFIDRTAVTCAEPIMGRGRRHPRDEAILAGLSATTTGLASRIAAIGAAARARTWLVEVHYPDAAVVAKISFATKGALLDGGLKVTDRLPTLAIGDIDLLADTPAMQAHAIACRRYFATGRLAADDAVVSLLILDSRETALHAGMCVGGDWTWLQ